MVISPLSIGFALLGGILTVFSPCVLPILPIVLGRSIQTHRYGPIALVAGLVAGFAVAGSLLGFASSWLTGFANLVRILAIASLLILGLFSIFPDSIFSRWFDRLRHRSSAKFKEPLWLNLAGEFWLGTQLGLLWTPCAGSVLGSIIVLAAVSHQVVGAFVLFVAYGIGAGLPMLVIAYASRYIGRSLVHLRPHSQLLQRVGGVIMAVTAIAILCGWDVQIQLWLAPLFPPLPL